MPTTTRSNNERRLRLAYGAFGALGIFLAGVLVSALARESKPSPYDASLPSPMGGLAATAPGDASGAVSVAGLEIQGADVAMGEVPLDITVVPQWTVHNPTPQPLSFTTGMPQVLQEVTALQVTGDFLADATL